MNAGPDLRLTQEKRKITSSARSLGHQHKKAPITRSNDFSFAAQPDHEPTRTDWRQDRNYSGHGSSAAQGRGASDRNRGKGHSEPHRNNAPEHEFVSVKCFVAE